MTTSFLSLPDEALRHVFRALGSSDLCDSRSTRPRHWPRPDDAQSLGNCCTRLNDLYRTSVRNLYLSENHSEEDCVRLSLRFPSIEVLRFALSKVPGCSRNEQPPSIPGPYPNCMVQSMPVVRAVELKCGVMPVQKLREMVENCAGLEGFGLVSFGIRFDRDASDDTGGTGTLSLERHAATLEELFMCASCINESPTEGLGNALTENSVDLRWLSLPSLSALKKLSISLLRMCNGSFLELAKLTSLESLSLCYLDITDEVVDSFLASLPQLHSLDLSACKVLTYRVVRWLPPQLEQLNISDTAILRIPPGAEEEHLLLYEASRPSQPTRTVKHIVVRRMDSPRFDYLLQNVSGASVEKLDLGVSKLGRSTDLAYFLIELPNLVELRLNSVTGLDESVFGAISKLVPLRQLILSKTNTSNECLVRLGAGPCRFSLRLIDLRKCSNFEDTKGTRLLLSSRFDGCRVIW